MSSKLKLDAIELVVLSPPGVNWLPSKAAAMVGTTRQRWHQRLVGCVKNGWVVKGPDGYEMSPRGVEVRDGVLRPLQDLQSAGKQVDLGELLAGPWAGMWEGPQT